MQSRGASIGLSFHSNPGVCVCVQHITQAELPWLLFRYSVYSLGIPWFLHVADQWKTLPGLFPASCSLPVCNDWRSTGPAQETRPGNLSVFSLSSLTSPPLQVPGGQ